jgi:hypothetical protein
MAHSIQEFLEGPHRRAWCSPSRGGQVYLRKTRRAPQLLHAAVDCIDISNLDLSETHGEGRFRDLVEEISSAAPQNFDFLFVENVLNEGFAEALKRKGWILRSATDDLCFFKRIERTK